MKVKLTILLFSILSLKAFSQEGSLFELTPEFMAGISAEANENFPDRTMQKQVLLNFGWDHTFNTTEWAQRLKGPKTGISVSYTDFGNKDSIGSSFTLLPFIEFDAFRNKKLKLLAGMGGSYFTKKYDSITNPNNQAITTDLVWSFRLFMYYRFLQSKGMDWRVGMGYFHHSNGHTRLPNQGLNSFLVSLSADIKNEKDPGDIKEMTFQKSIYPYLSFRAGYGANVLSKAFNDKKNIYIFTGEYGWIFNNTFKLGAGFYYRFYEHYYDYIKDEEFLVRDGEEFEDFKDAPFFNASNIGIYASGEVMLNHIGIDLQLGFNIHKPAYKIDWRINQGWSYIPKEIPPSAVLGEFDTKFRIKHLISTRMGMKYYLVGMDKKPKNNVFVGFHINANGGQADFTELSLGYVYHFKNRNEK
jgi:hypothetical protein